MPEKLDPIKDSEIRKRFPDYQFPAHIGATIDGLGYGFSRLKVRFRPELTQGMGFLHGGVISSLCDTAVGVALFTMIDETEKILTIEFKVNFIAPADKDIYAEARIIHKGRKTAVGEVDVVDGSGTLLAKALVTYYVYKD